LDSALLESHSISKDFLKKEISNENYTETETLHIPKGANLITIASDNGKNLC
jgi:hypothetical protein